MTEIFYYKSPIGLIRITTEDDALTEAVYINTTDKKEIETLKKSVPPPSSAIMKNCIAQYNNYFSGKNLDFDIPLNQSGTPFQQRVWKGLLKIGKGKTFSYLQFSKQLGNEKAIRAVGTANGKNKINIIVPCHRVIGSDGALVGYGGGLWRKQWLLAHEAKYCNGVQTLFK
jgi:methylated-DNA-[protein]-cysteine S-methyltransferase